MEQQKQTDTDCNRKEEAFYVYVTALLSCFLHRGPTFSFGTGSPNDVALCTTRSQTRPGATYLSPGWLRTESLQIELIAFSKETTQVKNEVLVVIFLYNKLP